MGFDQDSEYNGSIFCRRTSGNHRKTFLMALITDILQIPLWLPRGGQQSDVLVCRSCYNKILQIGQLKQQKCISRGSGGWKSEVSGQHGQVGARFELQTADFSLCLLLQVERERGSSVESPSYGTNPIMRALPHHLGSSPSSLSHLALDSNIRTCRGQPQHAG